jgi:hypothetical protein
LVSALSSTISNSGTWLVDGGASCHMTGSRGLFHIYTKTGLDLCVELGMGTKHAVLGSSTISFQLESGEVFRMSNVLWVPELKSSLSIRD